MNNNNNNNNNNTHSHNIHSDQSIAASDAFLKDARLNATTYDTLLQALRADHDQFWREKAQIISWSKPFTEVSRCHFSLNDFAINWFADGELNACYNCVDRHLAQHADKVALIHVGDDPEISHSVTYKEVHAAVIAMAHVLKESGVSKGDRVIIYMPMVLEALYAMLACARIGAVHSVVFGGFSSKALGERIIDCGARIIVTADVGRRGGKIIPLKANVDEALIIAKGVTKVLVVRVGDGNIAMDFSRDAWYHECLAQTDTTRSCPCEPMNAEDPMFILYTSGSTGKPKGLLHTTGGYMVWAALTFRYAFDYRMDDVFWCTADVGWITGHSYMVYGPMANAATQVVFEGVPTYPDSSRLWQEVDRHGVTIFYTAPTAIRALMRLGDQTLAGTKRDSLRVLATVGETINPEAWLWYYHKVGQGRCPVVDTWWQTETGGHMILPLPGATVMKPGSAGIPMFGVEPCLHTVDGKKIDGVGEGALTIAHSWPGQARTIYGDHPRFLETYFAPFPGYYFSGDGAARDSDGGYWITGRMDDVINVSGHRMGSAEVESALVSHALVAEAAVVGYPHDIKGQGIYAYVTLIDGINLDETDTSDSLRAELVQTVRSEIGPIASPDFVHFTTDLPKTRSGKIMRRILRKIACREYDSLGDISTLVDQSVVEKLIKTRKTMA